MGKITTVGFTDAYRNPVTFAHACQLNPSNELRRPLDMSMAGRWLNRLAKFRFSEN
jgi:hypothetical protein